MTFTAPTPFREALRRLERRTFPTGLSSADLARLQVEVLERARFSARDTTGQFADEIFAGVADLLSPVQVRRPDRVTPENPEGFVTEGRIPAEIRLGVKRMLEDIGYTPDPEHVGTIRDLSSDRRINFTLEHNLAETAAYGHHLQGADPDFADNFPAQELVRFEAREVERNWPVLWQSAVAEAGDTDAAAVFRATGRMIARKDSPVWTAISDFGRPWPPFKFGSGMGLRDVARAEAVELGVISRDARIEPPRLAFNETLPPLEAFPA